MQLFSADAKIFIKKNLRLSFDPEKLKKPPSKVAYFCLAVSVLPKSARSAYTVKNSHTFFNVSYYLIQIFGDALIFQLPNMGR